MSTPVIPSSPNTSGTPNSSNTPRRLCRSVAFPILIFVCCFMFGIWILPRIAFPVSYAINRGIEKAKVEAAKDFFDSLRKDGGKFPVWEIAPWVVKKVGPSVVGIKTVGTHPLSGTRRGYRDENLNIEYEPIFGEGSGVIVDKGGYIITNFHVIATAQAYQIRLSDGRTVEDAQLIGYDEATDLAVLKIDVSDLDAIDWGNSDDVEVGETVLAIGNPFGLSHTVTQGIISAKERYSPLPEGPAVQEFLQIDAAINPGNSGGPLVNIQGELIGINTAIYGETYRGIGFAIPSSLARKVYDQIRETQGNVKHGYMGVELEPLSKSFAEKNKLSVAKGAVVRSVFLRSPAEKADILPGDVIIKFGSHDIDSVVQLTHQIILTPPKTTVEVTLIRNGETIQTSVTLGERRRR